MIGCMEQDETLYLVEQDDQNDESGLQEVDEKDVEEKSCNRRFRFGEKVYQSKKEVLMPIFIKAAENDWTVGERTPPGPLHLPLIGDSDGRYDNYPPRLYRVAYMHLCIYVLVMAVMMKMVCVVI